MTTPKKSKSVAAPAESVPISKSQQVIDLLGRESGAPLDEMSMLAGWLPHSARSFMTGLKKKGHVIESDKIDGIRRYRIALCGNE